MYRHCILFTPSFCFIKDSSYYSITNINVWTDGMECHIICEKGLKSNILAGGIGHL